MLNNYAAALKAPWIREEVMEERSVLPVDEQLKVITSGTLQIVPLDELKTVAPSRRDEIVFALHDGGYTVREIERYTGISKSTVSRIVRAYARVTEQAEGSE